MSEKGVAVATIDTLLPEGIGLMKSQRVKKYSGSVTDIAKQLEIVENVPVETVPNPYNERYLRTKKERMGHTLHFNK